jgi:transposase
MKPPIFVRTLSKEERKRLEVGLRSKDAFVLRRSQMLLASSRGEHVPQIARNLGCGQQTVRDAIHDFNERGLEALVAGSSRPKRTQAAFDQQSADGVRELLHRSPREFGRDSSLWTLEKAAEVSFEEGLVQRRVSGETIRATLLCAFSECVGSEQNAGSPPPILCTKEKKAARPTDERSRGRPRVGSGLRGRVLVEPTGFAHLE